MTLEPINSATSLQESADGRLPCDWRVGTTLDLFGLEAVPANPSVHRGIEKARLTKDTYGLHGSVSLESAALQRSLENRLQQRLPTGGLTMFTMTWKVRATPLGRLFCKLVVSVGRTEGIDYGLWPTPQTLAPATATYNVSGSSDFTRRVDVALGLRESINGKRLLTENPGHLNPQFPCWLMGYSTEHLSSMLSAMQSYRKSPQRSSKRA